MAAECVAVARQTSDFGVRASLLEIAQKWLDLAERSEHEGWNEALRLRATEAASMSCRTTCRTDFSAF
jgi:hypothetical protein